MGNIKADRVLSRVKKKSLCLQEAIPGQFGACLSLDIRATRAVGFVMGSGCVHIYLS